MQWKSFVVKGAIAGALILGLAVGLVARGSIASAQTPPTTTQPATSDSNLWSAFLDNLASALNLDRTALDSTIVAAGNTTADEAVAAGTLTQAQADALKARLAVGDLKPLFGGRGGPHGGLGGPHVELHQVMLDAAASTLGITSDELLTQLRSGQTLAAIAQANGSSEQAVIDAALAAAKTELDKAVAAGTVTQVQADSIYSELQARGAQLFERGPHGGPDHGGPGRPDAPPAPADPTVTPGA